MTTCESRPRLYLLYGFTPDHRPAGDASGWFLGARWSGGSCHRDHVRGGRRGRSVGGGILKDVPLTRAVERGTEDLHNGGTHLLDLVVAVDHLARGLRHDFTVWDALDEALRWWLTEHMSPAGGAVEEPATLDGDSLGSHMSQALELVGSNPHFTLADVLQQAVRHWTTTMADRLNGGYHWPHPSSRRDFPPPQVTSWPRPRPNLTST
jgi:hypothetical protein